METPVPLTAGIETVTLICKQCGHFTTDLCKVSED